MGPGKHFILILPKNLTFLTETARGRETIKMVLSLSIVGYSPGLSPGLIPWLDDM